MKKICVICEICVTKKTSQEKSVYICEICGTKFSSDFTDESEGILAYRITHGFSRNLAAGQWLAPDSAAVVFCHADFADDADFFRGSFFVPQISQISTDFFMESLCPISGGICND